MSQKHYEATAEIFKEVQTIYVGKDVDTLYLCGVVDTIHSLARRMVEMMYTDNNRFKKDKWYRAAGLPELSDN